MGFPLATLCLMYVEETFIGVMSVKMASASGLATVIGFSDYDENSIFTSKSYLRQCATLPIHHCLI